MYQEAERVSALVCYLPWAEDEHINALVPGTWRHALFVCVCTWQHLGMFALWNFQE